ncbi:MAG: FMN-binding glutamate synthase family protein [Burkholderiales bacterium]|nr:FMN-binding glutamate synthase family protein [Burkholderiales bacterium]
MLATERRKWYLGFGIVLIFFFVLLIIVQANWYWSFSLIGMLAALGIYDRLQRKHTLLRNFPVLGHMHYILEFFRPEIQQYFVASDDSERPFDRKTRTIVYERAKGIADTISFGGDKDIMKAGYEWALHSLAPKQHSNVDSRIIIGNEQCTQPYSASRLNISALSFGVLSKNAIMALNLGAKKGNFLHNTGEGGLTEYHLQGGDVGMQVATAYFGFRTEDGNFDSEKFKQQANLANVKLIEIKLSQGAKPAYGGILPKEKITPEIARIGGIAMDKDLISPPTHKTFSTPEGLCHFIAQLRELSNGKPVGFKLCIGKKTEFFAICKAILKTSIYPDFIVVDGMEGGTGFAPAEFVDSIGMPLQEALVFVNNALLGCDLRKHIRIIASGKNATGFDMVRMMALGADIINSARAMMLALGCIQSKQCDNDTCPVGVATQNPRLFKTLDISDKSERVYNYHTSTVKSFTELVGAMGLENPSDILPSSVMRRINDYEVRGFDEIYEFIKPGCLLDPETVPAQYKRFWEAALPDTFTCVH